MIPGPESNGPLRVVFVIGSMREGGAENQLVLLMRGLRTRGHDVHLMLLHYEGVRLQPLLDDGFDVFDVRLPRFRPRWSPMPWLRLAPCLARSRRQVRAWRPSVVHAWLFWGNLWGTLITAGNGRIPLITGRRQLGLYKDGKPWMQTVENWCNRRTARIVPNAAEVARDCERRERLRPGQLQVIPNGIDADAIADTPAASLGDLFPEMADASHRAVVVANLLPYKGYFDLVEAWARVVAEFPRAKVLCVGRDDGIGPELRRRIAAAGLGSHVILAGARRDVPALLRGADLAVLPSHEEGSSNAVLESMAAGLAVVATRVGGNPEAVAHGESGLIVPPRNPAAMAEAVVSLLRDDTRRQAMGEAARRRVRERFSIPAMVDAYEALYRAVVLEAR